MPYDRIYSMQEVADTLYESESRESPTTGMQGHAVGQHGDMRQDIFDKRVKTVILLPDTLEKLRTMKLEDGFGDPIEPHKPAPKDGKFIRRIDMVRAVHEALNSPGGQQELRKLNGAESRVTIEMQIVRHKDRIRAAICQHPTINAGTKKKPKLVFVAGPAFYKEGFASRVVVVVEKLPAPNPECKIHIQTAYPKL